MILVVGACRFSSPYVWLPLLRIITWLSHILLPHLWIWAGIELFSVSWWISPPPCSFFDTLEGFSYYAMDCFLWYPPIYWYRLNTLWNIATVYPMVLSSLWNLTVSVLLYSRNSFLSWTMLFSTTVYYTWEFKRLDTSGNLSEKLADNEVGQMGTRYSSTAL